MGDELWFTEIEQGSSGEVYYLLYHRRTVEIPQQVKLDFFMNMMYLWT